MHEAHGDNAKRCEQQSHGDGFPLLLDLADNFDQGYAQFDSVARRRTAPRKSVVSRNVTFGDFLGHSELRTLPAVINVVWL